MPALRLGRREETTHQAGSSPHFHWARQKCRLGPRSWSNSVFFTKEMNKQINKNSAGWLGPSFPPGSSESPSPSPRAEEIAARWQMLSSSAAVRANANKRGGTFKSPPYNFHVTQTETGLSTHLKWQKKKKCLLFRFYTILSCPRFNFTLQDKLAGRNVSLAVIPWKK